MFHNSVNLIWLFFFIKSFLLGVLKNGSQYFALILVYKRENVQKIEAIWKCKGCLGVLTTDYAEEEGGWPLVWDVVEEIKVTDGKVRKLDRMPSKICFSTLRPWFPAHAHLGSERDPGGAPQTGASKWPPASAPAGTAGEHTAWLAPAAAHWHVAGGQDCLQEAMPVPAALWALGAFNLGSLI